MKKLIITCAILMIASVSLLAQHDGSAKVELRFNKFYDYDEIVAALQQLHSAYPAITRLESIGKSYQGRDMWLFTITNPQTGDEMDKPAMWVDGNIHGNEIQGAEAALYLIWYVLENYGKNDRITELVDRASFYVLPMLNPDGRAWWFAQANTSSTSRGGQVPTDNDRDGVADEDGPDDLDGDGSITQMRKKVDHGTHKLHPDDDRVLVRVDPDETGNYIMLGSEGIDNDGDGSINEDGPGGYDPNRNWGYNWMPNYVQNGAGNYPFSLPESRAVRDFVMAHPNIAGAQSFHNTGGMILRGPGAKNRGAYPRADTLIYDHLGRIGERMLPNYNYYIIWKDLYTVYGGSISWMTGSLGIFSFSNELDYSAREDMDADGQINSRERLEFDDRLQFGAGYHEWKPFEHPTFGEIEIGGWNKFTTRIPPTWMVEQTLHRNAAFTIFHAENMPELSISKPEVTELGDDTWRVRVNVKNNRVIPTRSAIAVQNKLGLPDRADLTGEGITVIAGGIRPERFDTASMVEHRPESLTVQSLGSMDVIRFEWIVTGSGEATITYYSEKAENVTVTVPLQ